MVLEFWLFTLSLRVGPTPYCYLPVGKVWNLIPHLRILVQSTTRITETSITNPTRITNEMATSSDYLMKYFNGILAVLLE